MDTTHRRRAVRLWTAAGLLVVGLAVSALWGLSTYESLQDRLDALPRTDVPGEVTFAVDAPQGVTVFYEDPAASRAFVVQSNRTSTLGASPVGLRVAGPDGSHEPVRYERDLRFDVDGRVAAALATFDAPAAGTYTLHVTGEVPDGVMVSVGDVITSGLLASAAGVVALFIATVVSAAVITVLALAGGSGSTAVSSEQETANQRPPVRA